MPPPLTILLSIAAYGLVHSVLASLRAKALARGWFGAAADRGYRLFFNGFVTLTLLPVLALPGLLPDVILYRISAPWVYLTLAGQVFAGWMFVSALLQTDTLAFLGLRQFFERPAQTPPPRLVVNGYYRWVRHPLYTAGLLFIWLSPVMTANWLALYAGFTLYLVIGAIYEERKLVREFGAGYEAYQARTPMLIPGLRRR